MGLAATEIVRSKSAFEREKAVVLERLPVLRVLLEQRGSKATYRYFEETSPRAPRVDSRLKEVAVVLRRQIEAHLGAETGSRAAEDFLQTGFISTADHHGPLSHPFFANSNLVQGMVNQERGLRSVLVLPCANVSLNNSSYPRGLFLHDSDFREAHIPFVGWKHRRSPVLAAPPYGQEAVNAAMRAARRLALPERERARVLEIISSVYGDSDLFACTRYADQIIRTNHALWRLVPGQSTMDLVTLPQEDVTAQLLQDIHLSKPTVIHRLLFHADARDACTRFFDGIAGAFSSRAGTGTFLFWHIRNGKRFSLTDDGHHALATYDRAYRVRLIPEEVSLALRRGEIVPSMALTFIVLSFYHGVRCGGGFSQINYLTSMKDAWQQVLVALGERDEAGVTSQIETGVFRGEFALAFLELGSRGAPATLLDVLARGDLETRGQCLRAAAGTLALEDAIECMMPEFHAIITREPAKKHAYIIPNNACKIR